MASTDKKNIAELAAKFQNPEWGAERLAQIGILRQLTHAELKKIYGSGKFFSLKAKNHAVVEGEATRGLFILLTGTVSVYKTDPSTGSLARLAVLEENSHFGELSLFDTAPRSATVAAETSCYIFYLDAQDFQVVLKDCGENAQLRFYKACSEELVERFRKLNLDYITSQHLLWKYALRKPDDEAT